MSEVFVKGMGVQVIRRHTRGRLPGVVKEEGAQTDFADFG